MSTDHASNIRIWQTTVVFWAPASLLCIAGQRREVQLVFGSEDHVLGPDLQDGRRLQGSGDGEESQLRWHLPSVLLPLVLTVEELESALNVQSL